MVLVALAQQKDKTAWRWCRWTETCSGAYGTYKILLIYIYCCAFVGLDNKLYKTRVTYININKIWIQQINAGICYRRINKTNEMSYIKEWSRVTCKRKIRRFLKGNMGQKVTHTGCSRNITRQIVSELYILLRLSMVDLKSRNWKWNDSSTR